MSQIQVDKIYDKAGTGAPQLTLGAEVPVGYGITGAGGINVGGAATVAALTATGNISATDATFSGTLTYEDVTNVDAVGIVTAQGGFEIGASGVGGTITSVGNAEFAGIVTATSYYGDASTLTNAGISAGKAVALSAFLGC